VVYVFRLGPFGATFIPGSVVPAEAVLYAARPGLRLWKADINGIVHTTFIFTNSSTKPQMLSLLKTDYTPTKNETGTTAVDFLTAQFGLLRVYGGRLLVSYTSTDLLVISPEETKQIMSVYADNILDVAVNRDEIYVLRKTSSQRTRPLIRLTQQPPCQRRFVSPPVDMSASCIYAEPHRELVLENVCYVDATILVSCCV